VTQIKIGVWPGTGFEWQMASTFSVQIFRLGILDYLARRTEPKQSYHLNPNRNLRNFSVNGKQPWARHAREEKQTAVSSHVFEDIQTCQK